MESLFCATPAKFRAWLNANHATAKELWVGFHKVDSTKLSITCLEAVDEALGFGWIDGVLRSSASGNLRLDASSSVIRFTPRKLRSTWRVVNIGRAKELIERGRMQPAGMKAFEARTDDRSAIDAYEQRHGAQLNEAETAQFQLNEVAREYFLAEPPSYRKAVLWWIVSVKKVDTRRKRLATLIDDSAYGRTIAPLTL